MLQRNRGDNIAEGLANLHIHDVFRQEHGNACDFCGKFFQFNAVELVNGDFASHADIDPEVLLRGDFLHRHEGAKFQFSQFAIGNYEEVAAATRGIKKAERTEFFLELFEGIDLALAQREDLLKLFLQIIKEQGAHQLQDIFFARIMRSKRASCFGVHDGLKHGTKDDRGDIVPLHRGAVDEQPPCFGVEIGDASFFFEKSPIHIGKSLDRCRILPPILRILGKIKDSEQLGEKVSYIRAISLSV